MEFGGESAVLSARNGGFGGGSGLVSAGLGVDLRGLAGWRVRVCMGFLLCGWWVKTGRPQRWGGDAALSLI